MQQPDSAIPFAPVELPTDLKIEEGFLSWQGSRSTNDQRWKRPNDATLLSFARLHQQNPEQIAAFASKNGVFRASHVKPEYERNTDHKLTDGSIWRLGTAVGSGREPLGLWMGLSQQMNSILRINAALKGKAHNPMPTIGTKDDWLALGGNVDEEDSNDAFEVEDAQFFLNLVINKWLAFGGVGLGLGLVQYSKKTTDWRLDITYNGLAGGLAYRLLLMVVGESSLFACSGCGTPYIRTSRAPKPGEENFCPDCKDVAKARALKRYREKNK